MDQLQTPAVVPSPQTPRFSTSKVVIAILTIFSLFLLITLLSVAYQNKQLRASNRELVRSLIKSNNLQRVEQVASKPIFSETITDECQTGFRSLESQFLSFCVPERFDIEDELSYQLISAVGEIIVFNVNFQGGFYAPCSQNEDVEVDSIPSNRISYLKYSAIEGVLDAYDCTDEYDGFTTIISIKPYSESDTEVKNIVLYYQKQETDTVLDLNEYKQIEQSIKIKKEYFENL